MNVSHPEIEASLCIQILKILKSCQVPLPSAPLRVTLANQQFYQLGVAEAQRWLS